MSSQKNKTCDIILISPMDRAQWISLPFALLYLSSYLEINGISTKIIDLKLKSKIFTIKGTIGKEKQQDFKNRYIETVLKTISKNKPSLIGLPCYTSEYNSVMELAQIIKKNTNTPIVVGGVHAALRPHEFIFPGSPIDFAIIGEGEKPLLALIKTLKNKYSTERLEGIAYLKNNKIEVNGICIVEEDLGQFPMPDYDKIDMDFYIKPHTGLIRNLLLSGIQIFTSRGCPYNCTFCANNYLRSKNKFCTGIRFRPIDQVIKEIELLVSKYKIDGFYIMDDCFMVSKERTVEFCKKLIEKKLDLVWGAETRVNFVTDEKLLKLMKKSGLFQLDFGVESGSSVMLKEINKRITVEQIKTAFELCKKNNIRTFANIMFNLPNETEEDVILTEKLLKEIKPSVLGMSLTVPLLGTKIYEDYVFPKLTPAEYELYNKNPSPYAEIIDRFILAKHNINFKKLMARLNSKYGKFKSVSFNPIYLRKVIKSKFLYLYIIKFINQQIDNLVSFFTGILRRISPRLLNSLKQTLGVEQSI
ncbi:MAG: B12-binding domain-containing radical SAM protein [Candidatus Nealsonbacteria bacterium]